jgi:hypothetical protein
MGLYERLKVDESGVGRISGCWTQIGPEFTITTHGKRTVHMVCKCICGRVSAVQRRYFNKGPKCSCFRRHVNVTTDKWGHRPAKYCWRAMIRRCTQPSHISYPGYGGRGITVCERWLESFDNFLEDVGPRPSPQHQLDRYPDNNGNYEPGNVRWATPQENGNNRRNNQLYRYNGELVAVSEIARLNGMSRDALYQRLHVLGWDIGKAISTPVRRRKKALHAN